MSITGFRDGRLRRFAEKNEVRKLSKQHLPKIKDILQILESGDPLTLFQLQPGYRLHELKGDRKGTWSVRVSGNWRITFRVDEMGNAYDLDLEDYH